MLKVEPSVPDGDAAWLAALRRLGFRRNRFATHPRRSWVLDIRPSEAELLAGMKEKWRYNVRLAGRKGVVVRDAAAPDDVDTFYRLYQETADRDGIFIHASATTPTSCASTARATRPYCCSPSTRAHLSPG